jgi:6-phosphogluconolactonase
VGSDGVLAFPPKEWRYTANAAHYINTDRSNRYAFVPHVDNRGGPNAIFQFKFDEESGRLTPNAVPMCALPKNVGPRHICFHPTLDLVYSSDEQGSSATAYKFDRSAGTLSPFQTISTLPDDYDETNTCSQIQISPSGKFLYVPNRGHDSIASFTIDGSTGSLTATGRVPTEAVPRAFSLDPRGNFLLVSGGDSGRLASYRVDQDNGTLTPLDTYEGGSRPMWVAIIDLAG